jgi:hypothetical protein
MQSLGGGLYYRDDRESIGRSPGVTRHHLSMCPIITVGAHRSDCSAAHSSGNRHGVAVTKADSLPPLGALALGSWCR